MSAITVVTNPDLVGTRLELILAEDRVGHYSKFRDFFVSTFDLDRVGLSEPGYLRAPSGLTYALVFVGRSGEPFPAGLEIYAVAQALEPVDSAVLDADLWAILNWTIAGVGPPWTVDDLTATGRLYQVPSALR